MKIGYQGLPGGHSLRAAKLLAGEAGLFEPEYFPLGSPENVVSTLMKGGVDYGVVAVYNSMDGSVEETEKALQNAVYMKVTAFVMPVRYCVFKADNSVRNTDINKLVSDARAFKMTEKTLGGYFPGAKIKETGSDTLAAKALAGGEYDSLTAVVCGREAGLFYGLTLIYENIEDGSLNNTLFYLISRAPKNT